MIKNYLNIAFCNLWKERLFSTISIVGLGVGIAVSIIIIAFGVASVFLFTPKNIMEIKYERLLRSLLYLNQIPLLPRLS